MPGKIACIGDSNTHGFLLFRRKRRCYPALLRDILGDGSDVRNFGASGYCAQKDAEKPYFAHALFAQSSSFQPDIALIMLGTNDAKRKNWRGVEPFLRDYTALLRHYAALPGQPRIMLLTPPAFFWHGRYYYQYGMLPEASEAIADAIRGLALREKLPLLDVQAETRRHPEYYLPDGVHFNQKGAAAMAALVANFLRREL